MTAMVQGTEGGNLDYFVIMRYSHYLESGIESFETGLDSRAATKKVQKESIIDMPGNKRTKSYKMFS